MIKKTILFMVCLLGLQSYSMAMEGYRGRKDHSQWIVPKCDKRLTETALQLNELVEYLNNDWAKSFSDLPISKGQAEWHGRVKKMYKEERLNKDNPFLQMRDDARLNEMDSIKITQETLLPNVETFKKNVKKFEEDNDIQDSKFDPLLVPGAWISTDMQPPRTMPVNMGILAQCRHLGQQLQDLVDINYRIVDKPENSTPSNNGGDVNRRLENLENEVNVIKSKLRMQ